MKGADLAPGRHGGLENLGAEQAAGVDQSLAAVQAHRVDDRWDGVVGHGQDHQLDFVENCVRLDESPCARDQAAEALAPACVPAGDRKHRPAGAAYSQPQRRADGPGADDADAGCAAPALLMRMRMHMRVDQVAVPVARHLAARVGRRRLSMTLSASLRRASSHTASCPVAP